MPCATTPMISSRTESVEALQKYYWWQSCWIAFDFLLFLGPPTECIFIFLPNLIYIAHISRLQAFHCLHFLFIIGQSAIPPPPLRSLLRSVPKYTQPGSCCLTTNLPLCCHRYVLALARTCGSLQREIFRFTGCHLDKELKIIININK